ncbi:MAG: YmdB family metallophosphoesterase [Deltaproteobacteria bacterium]|uniref:YmdB family metallophosphoesterase n=1 Tax=Candidatus Zymogenus saltonus TaxID=2844893 RepID=A0A9D8K9H6_9DELT|nr:YmdB family metallophosphoesterase [Candidatus Zymogenus saltonus]
MKLLFFGVVVGSPGREAVAHYIERLERAGDRPDLVIANGNYAAGGAGLTGEKADELFKAGVDVITTGENVWDQKDLQSAISNRPEILRPENLPEGSPGSGVLIKEVGEKKRRVGIVNIVGYSFMGRVLPENPFPKIRGLIKEVNKETDIIIVDFFAKTTAEKVAMTIHLDGMISLLCGSGTLVQTADESVSRLGTAAVTDVGMAGAANSVLGFEKEREIKKFRTAIKAFSTSAKGKPLVNAVLVEIDDASGRAVSIVRINEVLDI